MKKIFFLIALLAFVPTFVFANMFPTDAKTYSSTFDTAGSSAERVLLSASTTSRTFYASQISLFFRSVSGTFDFRYYLYCGDNLLDIGKITVATTSAAGYATAIPAEHFFQVVCPADLVFSWAFQGNGSATATILPQFVYTDYDITQAGGFTKGEIVSTFLLLLIFLTLAYQFIFNWTRGIKIGKKGV